MTVQGGRCLLLCLTLLAGCGTSRPSMKPEATVERLAEPSEGYDAPVYPREAFDRAIWPPPPAGNPPKYIGTPSSSIGSGSNGGKGPYGF